MILYKCPFKLRDGELDPGALRSLPALDPALLTDHYVSCCQVLASE